MEYEEDAACRMNADGSSGGRVFFDENNNLIDSDPIEAVVLSVFLIGLAALLIVTQNDLMPERPAAERADIGEKRPFFSKETACGLLLILLVALMACIFSTLVSAQLAALIANKVKPKTLNITVGVVLLILGIVMLVLHSFF